MVYVNDTDDDVYYVDFGSDGIFQTADLSGEVRLPLTASVNANFCRIAFNGRYAAWGTFGLGKTLYDFGPDRLPATGDDPAPTLVH